MGIHAVHARVARGTCIQQFACKEVNVRGFIRLYGVLEKKLAEPFRTDYQQLPGAAGAHLKVQYGSV